MTLVEPFRPADEIAPGRTIIEASAGTGKTFTIAAVVARLVSRGVGLERILVVTFTRAATAELKGRVRDRLSLTLSALEGLVPPEPDDHLRVILDLPEPVKVEAADRLREALSDFDRSQIFTIHGFAQRLLGQLGFRVRLPETLEPGDIDDVLLGQVASDVVVSHFAHNPFVEPPFTPTELARMAREVLAHPDATVVPDPASVSGVPRLRAELAMRVADEARRRMRRAGAITFDDGLVEVRDALFDPEVGQAATEMLRRRYDVGLVDESQDTDPIQWEIIRRVFDQNRLVVIGDPKQSIYSFRGADIEAYLSAVEGAAVHTTLDTNWRSDGPLVEALDVLFTGATFGDERIRYRRVRAANDQARIDGVVAPLHLRLVDSGLPIEQRRDGFFRVDPCREAVAADAAAEVVRLLQSGVHIEVDSERRRLGPADIAVLCRTRKQIDMVRRELDRRRVPSVTARTGAVMVTAAAEEWRRFLLAVERPDRMDLVRLAATTLLVGEPLPAVAGLTDEQALDLQRRMRGWHDTLQVGGVPALMAELDRTTGLAGRILALPDGERMMTDLTHIAEELHSVFRRGRQGSLAAWLATAMEEASDRQRRNVEEPESRQRRLETDADAVTVQTIHGAKGLEYPVVLVPYGWDVSTWDPAFPIFHDPDHDPGGGEPRRRLLDLGGDEAPDFADHARTAREEEEAEESRLLYVALTRARHHLVVWWVENHASLDKAKLTELLTGGDRTPEGLAAQSAGTIAVSTMTEMAGEAVYEPPAPEPVQLEAAQFDRPIDASWRRVSFSSLSADQPLTALETAGEHGLRSDEGEAPPEDPLPLEPQPEMPLADLPAGARFGTLVHDVLEHLRFDDPELEATTRALLDEEMRTGGWEFDASSLVAGIRATVETPLGPDPDSVDLRQLERNGLARELFFEIPVRTASPAVTLADVGRVMDATLPHDDPYRDYIADLLDSDPQPFRGFMTGAIDLVGVLPTGQFVVMDYKSNALPARGDVASVFDYAPSALTAEMVSHRYVLQATLYQVALHRYLQWRLPGYDPRRNLGGSMYLFVRGMIGPATPVVDGERCGVARWAPPPEMVIELSRLFAGGDDE